MRGLLRRILRSRKKEEVAEVEKPRVEEAPERESLEIGAEELQENVGRHIAIVGGKIVSSAKTAKKAFAKAKREHSGEEIVIRYVASERLLLKCKCLED